MHPNILITSSSSKVLLVKAFIEAAKPYGAKVYSADIKETCATSFVSDKHIIVPRLDDENASNTFLRLCAEHKIGLIIPTRDGELKFFAQLAKQAEDNKTRILVCDVEGLSKCQHKGKFAKAVNQMGLQAVPNIHPDDPNLAYPLFTRMTSGSASVGAYKIETPNNLPERESWDQRLFHPFIDAKEYSVDLLMDITPGKALQAVVRERIEVVNGEAKISRVISHPELSSQACQIGENLNLVGHNVLQAFITETNEIYIIEVNPRFGGASNLSIRAGLDSVRRICALHYEADTSAYDVRDIKIGAMLYRFSDDIIDFPA